MDSAIICNTTQENIHKNIYKINKIKKKFKIIKCAVKLNVQDSRDERVQHVQYLYLYLYLLTI